MANFNFNKVILGGRLTKDPMLKTTTSGLSLVQFSVAVSRRVSKNSTNGQAEADFINCSAFGQQAEFISKFFRKGSSICVVGRIQNDNYTDQQGVKHYSTNVMVEEANFVDAKGENTGASQSFGAPTVTNTGYVPDNYSTSSPAATQPASTAPRFEDITDDDELPF